MEVALNYQLDPSNPQILFINGGPGSGKGTQCERLVRDYHFEYISVGDVVRDEANRDTPEGKKLQELMKQGILVSDQLVVNLLDKKIKETKKQKYLLDGFPGNIEQAKLFEKTVKEIDLIININCDEEKLVKRLIERGKTSGRADDNEETIKNRIRTFHQKTEPVVDYYRKFGKIKQINGDISIDEVYKQVKRAIKPNMIFFWGPPSVGKTSVGKIIAQKTQYLYIDYERFARQHKCKTQQEITNRLIEYCDTVPHMCIVVDSFFVDFKQAKVFFEHFVEPQYVYYLDSPKDDVMSNISKYYKFEKEKTYQRKMYESYICQRNDLLTLMKDKPYFKRINAADTIENIVAACLEVMRPLTLVAFTHNNQDLAYEYFFRLEKERGFIYCDMQELTENEVDRCTSLGKRMSGFTMSGKRIPSKYQTELIEKIMFNEPENKKFVFANFPEDQSQFAHFEKELYPIDFLINFEREDQTHQFQHKNTPTLNYFCAGKEIVIRKDALDILDSYVNQRAKFGFVTGPGAGGKSTIAKHLASQFNFEIIDWEKLIEELKVKLGSEDGPLEEVNYGQVENYFADKLNPQTCQTTVLFDGFPYDNNQLNSFLQRVGLPTFIIHLNVGKEQVTARFKLLKEMEPEAELDEDSQAKIQEYIAKSDDLSQFWGQVATNYGTKLYKVCADISLESTKKAVNQILYRRVLVVQDLTQAFNKQRQCDNKLLYANLCRQKDITFVDVSGLIKAQFDTRYSKFGEQLNDQYNQRWTQQEKCFPSNYTTQLVVDIIKNYLNNLKFETRDVLIYGYPSADCTENRKPEEIYFPRSSDELLQIERQIGPIRFVSVINDVQVLHKIEDAVWELEKPEVKEVKKVEGEEDEPIEDKQDDEEDKDKPKFNVYDYIWTKSNGIPKNVAQWFAKSKKATMISYSLEQNGYLPTFENLGDFFEKLNEENEQNKEEVDYRKVNLLIQLTGENFQGIQQQKIEEEFPEIPVEEVPQSPVQQPPQVQQE